MYILFYARSSLHGVALSRDRDRDGARAAAQLPGSCSLLAQLTLRHLVTIHSICTRPCQRACFASWRDTCARLRRQDPSWSALSQHNLYHVCLVYADRHGRGPPPTTLSFPKLECCRGGPRPTRWEGATGQIALFIFETHTATATVRRHVLSLSMRGSTRTHRDAETCLVA